MEAIPCAGWHISSIPSAFPLRLLAFIIHPLGVGLDLIVQQPMYLLASTAPGLFGYTYMDEVYQETTVPYRYHWRQPVR